MSSCAMIHFVQCNYETAESIVDVQNLTVQTMQ